MRIEVMPNESDKPLGINPVLYLLYDELPTIKPDPLRQKISSVEPKLSQKNIGVEIIANEKSGIYASVEFDNHLLRLVGLAAPLPAPELQRCLQPAHLNPQQKQSLAAHKTHMICTCEGNSSRGVEKFIALYKLAYALSEKAMRGVVNPMTWMCQSSDMLPNIMTSRFLDAFRSSPANSLAIWLGFVKFFKPNNTVWFATKGNPFFGVPDFAYLGKSLAETDEIYDIFAAITTYAYQSEAHIAAGHTLQIGEDTFLRFRSIWKYADYLGEKTLVIEKTR